MDRVIEKKKWTTRKILNIAAIAAFAFFLLYLLTFRDKRSKLYVDRSQVTIASVLESKFQEFIPVDGVVFPKNTIYIEAVQGGFVEKVYVEDGAMLKKGDTILKLANANMELSLMEQETRIFEAVNNLQNTKIGLEQNKFYRQQEIVELEYKIDQATIAFERMKKLYEEDVISQKEFEDAERDNKYTIKQLAISIELKKLDSISAVTRSRQIEATMDRMQENLDMLRQNLENL